MRKTTSQADLEEEASKKQSMSKCPQKNSTHFKKAQLLLFNYTTSNPQLSSSASFLRLNVLSSLN